MLDDVLCGAMQPDVAGYLHIHTLDTNLRLLVKYLVESCHHGLDGVCSLKAVLGSRRRTCYQTHPWLRIAPVVVGWGENMKPIPRRPLLATYSERTDFQIEERLDPPGKRGGLAANSAEAPATKKFAGQTWKVGHVNKGIGRDRAMGRGRVGGVCCVAGSSTAQWISRPIFIARRH